ncbi:MAG: NAD(P)-dependent oxidoreductase [Acidobacteriota bacterium]
MVDSLGGRPVLVTGARGFIGAHLCRHLVALGADVHGTGRRTPEHPLPGVRWWCGDLAKPDVASRLIRGIQPDVVFHLASRVVGARDRALVRPTLDANLVTTVELLDAITTRQPNCRLVLAGSLEEPTGDDTVPSSPYAAAKWAATAYARMYHALYQTRVNTARIFMVYGPAGDPNKLVPYVVRSLLAGTTPELSSGARPVDWIHVDDVARGLIALALTDRADGKHVDLGTGVLTTVREVVETIFRLVDGDITPSFGTLDDRPFEQVKRADLDTATTMIDWRPRIDLETGLRDTIEWYRNLNAT